MPVIDTSTLLQGKINSDTEFVYNGLDSCITMEVFEEVSTLYNQPPDIYSFSRALQAPVLEMMMRGFRVDEYERQAAIRDIRQLIETLNRQLQVMAYTVWDQELNPRSPKQLLSFFYGKMKLPEIWSSQKGIRKLSMNMETLEKLEVYLHARPIIAHILRIRELAKMLSVLETEIDSDNRMRTSYNIGGTESGRFSSSANAFGTGTNLQNLRQDPDWKKEDGRYKISLRKIFIADPGYKICGIDLEQAESREVGYLLGTLFDDWTYLDACEAGDLHTKTCQLIWDNLGWTSDPKADRKIADQNFYRQFSYRDMSKRGGHGSNYLGTPFTMARHLKVPTRLMENFQSAYFRAYPVPRWHTWTAGQIQTIQQLTTPFGRRRHFFGRPNDDTTLREAVAYVPQSATADRMNLALWRIWYYMGTRVQLLAQVHDAVYFQFPENANVEAIISEAIGYLRTPFKHTRPNGQVRTFDVPGEAKVGWNWGNYHEKYNPDGLMKWKGQDDRKRSGSGLQRIM
jgi:DNA polymerase I-like protein with 3'-5' exonuclease and polymerase domains